MNSEAFKYIAEYGTPGEISINEQIKRITEELLLSGKLMRTSPYLIGIPCISKPSRMFKSFK